VAKPSGEHTPLGGFVLNDWSGNAEGLVV